MMKRTMGSKEIKKIYIDPRSRIFYTSFYIQGLYDFVGKSKVGFSLKHFTTLDRQNEDFSFEHYFPFVIVHKDGRITKIIIDFCDPPGISIPAYDWCDYYGKINYNEKLTSKKFRAKIIILPPSFGVKIWNLPETLYYAVTNSIKCRLQPLTSIKRFFKDYYLQYKRPLITEYENYNSKSKKSYVFLIASLWKDESCIKHTNLQRKRFMEICKELDLEFEGGFLATSDHPYYESFRHLSFKEFYPPELYLNNTKASSFVFNTPAVHQCHGWKLAEFFAMNKAIISTPLFNDLSKELVHQKNIHFVNDEIELKTAIENLLNDQAYKNKLEEGAYQYYSTNIKPEVAIENFLGKFN